MCVSFKQFLFETSYRELERNVINFRPKTKKRQKAVSPLKLSDMQINAALGVKTLRFVSNIIGSTGTDYKVTIQFNNVDYESKEHTFKDKSGKTHSIAKLTMKDHDVLVRCQCLDFYFRFGYYNHLDKSIFGPKPKKYERKTDWFPPVNPDEVPGFCKHVIKTVNEIISQGFMKN